jgi:hypothetical protein
MLPAAVQALNTVVSLPCTAVASGNFLALQRNNVIIKPKTVTQNYCLSVLLNLYNLDYSEYNFKLAHLNITNEKIAIACCRLKAVSTIHFYLLI